MKTKTVKVDARLYDAAKPRQSASRRLSAPSSTTEQ